MKKSLNNQSGFSFIEALVSLIIIGVGLLGLGGMQIASIKGTNNAHSRTAATMIAMSLNNRMQANPSGVDAGDYTTVATNCSNVPTLCNKKATTCTPTQTAQFDLYDVMCGTGGALGQLINASLSVACPDEGAAGCATPKALHIIRVEWDETNVHSELDTELLEENQTQRRSVSHEIVP